MAHHQVPDTNRQHARRMRHDMTQAELRFWNAVRAHRLMGLGFRRQMPIGGYIVDFACPEHRLVIEVDGVSHSHDEAIVRDGLRDQRLSELGWQTLRFTNEEALHHVDDVCMHILRVIEVERFD